MIKQAASRSNSRKRGSLSCLAQCLCLFLLAFPAFAANEVITLTTGDYAPYTSSSDPRGKLLEEIVREAFKLESVDVQYSYAPWLRSYALVRSGQVDGTFPWSRLADRERDFCFHEVPLIKDSRVYFHLKSASFDWRSIEDLKQYNVGVSIGYNDEKVYKNHGIVADVASSDALNFKKLLAGRIDVYRTSKVVGYYAIQSLFDERDAQTFTHHPKVAYEAAYYTLFSKETEKGQKFCRLIDSGLQKLKRSGAYDKIVASYISVLD